MGTNSRRRIGQVGQVGFLRGRKGSALSTPKNDKSILVTTSRQSITIPVTLYKMENGKIAETTALVDSGATICCINLHFVRRMKWPLQRLGKPIEARNADGTSNKGGMIRYQVDLNLRIEERNSLERFFIMDLGNKNTIILGHPWLTRLIPSSTGWLEQSGREEPLSQGMMTLRCSNKDTSYDTPTPWKRTTLSLLPESTLNKGMQ